ncbi:MAG: YggS family pyridoxal phosphate-dependent enzyme [Bacteroidetes bacterium]|nr:YggS family pyridoxal phosphate-dependent enzyme [Bacteroidota bacterium]MDA0937694.1 YggS family pyridoxal phosphate-dependent enzyme [Bacteroidota bacterium]MDA1344340.1 YggS family pyridoxal phosphate-dependent enzyme [Bacteroidota bacterium]
MNISDNLNALLQSLPSHVTLVAVSKTKPLEDLKAVYNTGHRIFGENKVQELVSKWEALPKDIQWHMIGHLQRNKVKYITPFVHLIHGVDSERLLNEIDKQAAKNNRKIPCLLQIHIAQESTKFGLSDSELEKILSEKERYPNVHFKGLMGMASFTSNLQQVNEEFAILKALYDNAAAKMETFDTLSMGMSGDYELAIAQGSTMIRVGSKIFGERNYS